MSKITMEVDGSRILVNANSLNRVYNDLAVLGRKTGDVVKMCDYATPRALQAEIKVICFRYARCYGELNRLILEGKK